MIDDATQEKWEAKGPALTPRNKPNRIYYATFGLMYASEAHPMLPWAHPQGYVRIIAPDYDTARAVITGMTLDLSGGMPIARYSDLHEWPSTPEGLTRLGALYPRGALCTVEVKVRDDA